ncbi:MAG: nucleoside phosphorylase [Desulfobacterales bacterium]|nr:nucleoside phosphorylase [Desulfobacterales bacterium]
MDFFDPDGEPLVTPRELVKNLTRPWINTKALHVEACALICVIPHDLRAFVKLLQGEPVKAWKGYREVYQGRVGEGRVTIARTPAGAPACVALAEELASFGTKQILFVGYCGSLQPSVRAGDIIVPGSAIREEGTSYHYLPPSVAAHPNEEIQGVIRDCLQRRKIPFHQGTIWTTDAIYRETKGKVKHYQAQGVLGVEMELAALFAFGMARQVAIGGLLVVADELSAESWRPRFFSPRQIKGVRQARKAVVEIVKEMVSIPLAGV